MSLDVRLVDPTSTYKSVLYEWNITHNLSAMAKECYIYECLWRPDETNINKARDLIIPLQNWLKALQKNPSKYKKFDAENKRWTYEGLVWFVSEYLDACNKYPEAKIWVRR